MKTMKIFTSILLLKICCTTIIAQNVGIGITPSQKLDVNGNLKINGAFMPGNVPGSLGQVLLSAGPNTSPTWANNVESFISSKAFVNMTTNTADVSVRNIFSNSSTATSQTDSVDFGNVRYNLGTDFSIANNTGIGNKLTINAAGLYKIEGVITLLLQNPSAALKPTGSIEIAISSSSNITDGFTAQEPLFNTGTAASITTYQKSFLITYMQYFQAGDKFTFRGSIRNLSNAPHDNIGMVSPSYFSIYKISD